MTTLGNETFQFLAGAVHIVLAVGLSAHIILTKEDVRAAIGWTGLVWLAPYVGSILYLLLGINRIRRQAGRIRRRRGAGTALESSQELPGGFGIPTDASPFHHGQARLVTNATGVPLTRGNTVEPLIDGDEAYPAMIEAVDRASRSVGLVTYIFDRGRAGDRFADALARAVARGVEVRVLIDGVGARYSRPPIVRELRRRGVPVALFLPSYFFLPYPYSNLRNHRKIMVVDGVLGFCGGMNIRDQCLLQSTPKGATRDLHFRLRGPVVRQLVSTFAFDWSFTTKEQLGGPTWFRDIEPAGDVYARGIPDGPDEDFETLLMTLLGALAMARRSIRVATPYFLPDPPIIDAFRTAALRGVEVEILLPAKNNLRLVHWAAMAQLKQVVRWGCQVYFVPPPFDHSKLMVVDGEWSLLGSANWDPRSLRLNFEYVVECYSTVLAGQFEALLDAKRTGAHLVSRHELSRRSFPVKMRDGLARLAQPYL
ncbi:MAG: phospholipase D-like domain-containing protein [Gemmatimonadales bacterium]